eukprot:TRINITY_DN8505_c0_g1_i1.p2 TRINITY_DN8505_c0_g1~~TRINITY_DN8505_c0_g1_i1.p2  ORF type:complete len:110 (+),score=5.63 TRINITY_DN8505_c0_g1_i1:109-438(+)
MNISLVFINLLIDASKFLCFISVSNCCSLSAVITESFLGILLGDCNSAMGKSSKSPFPSMGSKVVRWLAPSPRREGSNGAYSVLTALRELSNKFTAASTCKNKSLASFS